MFRTFHFRFKAFTIVLAGTIVLNGCATLFGGSEKKFTIETIPSGATVSDENDKEVGRTPYEVSIDKESKRIYNISKDDYEKTNVTIRRRVHHGFLFLDAVALCIPCIVDAATGKLFYTSGPEGAIQLKRLKKKFDNKLPVYVGPVIWNEKMNQLGKISNMTKRFSDSGIRRVIGYDDAIAYGLATELNGSYFEAELFYPSRLSDFSVKRPKIIIQPVIDSLSFALKGNSIKTYSGTTYINGSFRFFKTLDTATVIGSFPFSVSLIRTEGQSVSIGQNLLAHAVGEMINTDSMYEFIKSQSAHAMSESKGNAFSLKPALTPNYSSSKEMLKSCITGVVTIESTEGLGSGFIISSNGYLLTNYHVIGNAEKLNVKLNASFKLGAEVVKTNKDFDLALLKVDAEDMHALSMGNSDSTSLADDVYAIGTPLESNLGQTITKGIISGYREFNEIKYIQTDVSINPGNSGGPLLNEKGEVIGITTMKLAGKGIEGIGFCIPSNVAIEMLNIQFEK